MSVVLDTHFLCIANIMELHAIAFVNFSHSRKLMLMLQITICCSLALCLRFQFQLKTLQVKCGKYCTQMAHLKSTYFEYGSHEGDTLNRRKDAWKKRVLAYDGIHWIISIFHSFWLPWITAFIILSSTNFSIWV